MKFMFMIYHDEKVLDAMPEQEMQALVDSAIEYAEEIRRSGHYIASDALQRTRTARTIRVSADKVSNTVGPFAETKDCLGGFFVIEAKDMDEACAVAARFPPARVGVVEIRPVRELKHSRDGRGLPS
ncbi:MAG: dehydrogenase [Candidatus Rokuibacteriota bacterium]|nr:MAG: dehydrogenase [Candidatus Rokubacteria bacterium]